MTQQRKSAQHVAYENGRKDALWKIPGGFERANRYSYSGHSMMFARAWDRGWDEVVAEFAARETAPHRANPSQEPQP